LNASALTFSAVSKSFESIDKQVAALEQISFSIQPGKVTGLIGPDGAGKTTLMRLAAGLLRPDTGEIRVLDIDVLKQPLAVQSSVGYMPQRFGLYEDLSVQENLDLYADLHGVPKAKRFAHYAKLMQMTDLALFTQRLAGRLSGGMKQKLGLACTLVSSPQLLLLDEPTVGVDPVSRRELWQIVYEQVQDAGMTVLLSTAYLDEAERCDEVLLVHQGKLLQQAAPAQFSHSVTGRTFLVSTERLRHRRLQEQLSRAPGVLDAVIDGEAVRVVTDTKETPTADALLPDETDVRIAAVAPRFEDAFVARLKIHRDTPQTTPALQLTMAQGENDEVIRADKLQRRFGDFIAVNSVSFSVRRGEIFGLLGANGAGKSTTFRMLCGLLPVSGGELAVAGHDLRYAAASARGRIGYMAQKFSLYSNLSVIQNLRFFSSAYGLHGKQQKARLDWALNTFELISFHDANAGDLPLGYKQRLSFAAALMHEPEILFLDEPTSGIDPLARREFWSRTNALAEAGVTVMVTTHFMEEANYCDRLLIMADGEVLTGGTPMAMKARAQTVENPNPSMEDAFIQLIEQRQKKAAGVAV
jgi:ABC-2 type transport system ATP-binding protein